MNNKYPQKENEQYYYDSCVKYCVRNISGKMSSDMPDQTRRFKDVE